ncbi:MAG: MAPEG family protein [Gammaproteobacteria bacterium]|nr:MAPEG family protein [Gammaproteobacteria bacterium]
MEITVIIVMLALAQYMYFTARAGMYRNKYKIAAPACTGNEQFERAFRVQQNSLEQLVIFIPAQLIFAWYVSALWGAVLGLVYLAGRFLYASAYINNPEKRAPGMLMTFIPNAILVLGVVVVMVLKLV